MEIFDWGDAIALKSLVGSRKLFQHTKIAATTAVTATPKNNTSTMPQNFAFRTLWLGWAKGLNDAPSIDTAARQVTAR